MTCTHSRGRYRQVETMDWDGNMHHEEVWETYSTQEDIDLHRFKCTQCGEIGYYSGAARKYYEQGVRSPGITGLE